MRNAQEKENNEKENELISFLEDHCNACDMATCLDIYSMVVETYGANAYIGVSMNALDDVVLVVNINSVLYLLGPTYKTIMYAPRLMYHISNDQVHIDDVISKTNCIGNGSVLMTYLIVLARTINATSISGYLSNVDDDHASRRNYFYKKFGFEVGDNSILLRLD